MKTPNFHLAIDYDEGEQDTYRAVVLTIPGGHEFRFGTRDPAVDFKRAQMIAYAAQIKYPGAATMMSSSVDHFVMDGDRFRWNEHDEMVEIEVPAQVDYDALGRDQQYAVAVMRSSLQSTRTIAWQQAQAYPDLADVFVQMDDAYRAFVYRYGLLIEPIFDEAAHRLYKVADGDDLFTYVYGKDHPELAIMPKGEPRAPHPRLGAGA